MKLLVETSENIETLVEEKEVFVAIAQQLTRNVNGPVVVVDDGPNKAP